MYPGLRDRWNNSWMVILGKSRVGWSEGFVFGSEGPHPDLCHQLRVSHLRAGRDHPLDNALRTSGVALLRLVLASLYQ